MLLQDMYDNYWSHGTDWDISGRTNSGGSIKLYGHQRKVQEQMVGGQWTFTYSHCTQSLRPDIRIIRNPDLSGPFRKPEPAAQNPDFRFSVF